MRKLALCFVLLFLCFGLINAQEEENALKVYQKLEAGYMFGGQAYNDNFSYNPGFQVHGAFGIHISKRFNAGLGLGYYQLTKEKFLPIFAEVNGYTRGNDKISNIINFQLGYAPAWYSEQVGYNGYDYKGGIYFDAGMGVKIKISEATDVYFKISYRHQFAHITYELYPETKYKEALNYDLFNIAFGIKFSK